MEVSNYKIGRIVKIEDLQRYIVGQSLSQPQIIANPNFSPKKLQIEDIFEDVRMTNFPDLPSRLNSLFVFPLEERHEQEWLSIMYPKLNVEYVLLTLVLNGNLYWFDANYYNDSYYADENSIKRNALNYWQVINDYLQLPLVEGLFIGNAIVENIEVKYYYGNEGETIYL